MTSGSQAVHASSFVVASAFALGRFTNSVGPLCLGGNAMQCLQIQTGVNSDSFLPLVSVRIRGNKRTASAAPQDACNHVSSQFHALLSATPTPSESIAIPRQPS